MVLWNFLIMCNVNGVAELFCGCFTTLMYLLGVSMPIITNGG
jgi:hypothetical protein